MSCGCIRGDGRDIPLFFGTVAIERFPNTEDIFASYRVRHPGFPALPQGRLSKAQKCMANLKKSHVQGICTSARIVEFGLIVKVQTTLLDQVWL
jgi:hypothetical protein